METFSPIEMATIFRQAMNKQDQIKVFAQTQLKEEAEIVKELVEAGVDKRTIPYKYRDFIPKDEKKPARKPVKKVHPDSIETRGMRDMEDAIIEKLDAQRAEIPADEDRRREETAQRLQRAIDEGLGQEPDADLVDAADTGDSSSVFCEDRKKPSPCLPLSEDRQKPAPCISLSGDGKDKRTVPVSADIEKMVKDIQQTQVEVAELIAERDELLAGLRKIRAAIDYVHQMLHEGE